MRLTLLLISYLVSCISLHAQTPDYPPIEEVVEKFFTEYSVPQPAEIHVQFERRPNGYFVVELDENFQPGRQELYFHFSNQSYGKLKLFEENQEEDGKLLAANYIRSRGYNISQFSMVPFHGYNGWYKDVIALYENADSLSDWELNALGRAYQTASASLFHNFSGFADTADQFELRPGQNALSQEQVDQFLDLARKGIATYDRLWKQNPDFITPVGPAYTKYCNEIMDAFVLLLYHQNEETARQVLIPGLYDPYLLKGARNFLQSCPPDAVLFTYGDTDTYPLYYLQATEGLRTDVIIANLSLLAMPRYLSMVYAGPLGAKPLNTGLPDLYFQEVVIWQKMGGSSGGSVEIQSFYEKLGDTSLYQSGISGQYHLFSMEPGSLDLPVPKGASRLFSDTAQTVTWGRPDNYFLPEKISQLDMVYANDWSRPLCFSLTCQPSIWAAWNPHLAIEGLVYRLYPDKMESIRQIGQGKVNTERGFHLWMNEFQFETSMPITALDKAPFHQSYLAAGYALANALQKEGDNDRALIVARTFPEHFPDLIDPWDARWLKIAELHGACGDPKLAQSIGLTILDNYEMQFEDRDPREKEYVKERLSEMAEKYELKKLGKKLR